MDLRVYISAALWLSSRFGIPGLIYANCINMAIRIGSSLYFAFGMETSPRDAMRQFTRDLVSVDLAFIVGMVKEKLQRRKTD